ncbi:hypothetical protein ACFL6X_02750 [Candidatus Latescibacterota bacterium]
MTDPIGSLPYRLALAGGWIDQPFVSRCNPEACGSMVVVGLEPTFRWMDRCGLGSSTRKVASALWNGHLPEGDPADLVRQLYRAENDGKAEPSGSQDMAGLIYPGVSRLDYSFEHEGGYFPVHVESNTDPRVALWLERVIQVLPVAPRPPGYNPLGEKNLDPEWIRRLGTSGRDCFAAIAGMDASGLGASMNECMRCWEAILPHVVRHPTLTVDLMALLEHYQARSDGAMYSGCGGGYLYIVSGEPIPGTFRVQVRIAGGDPA